MFHVKHLLVTRLHVVIIVILIKNLTFGDNFYYIHMFHVEHLVDNLLLVIEFIVYSYFKFMYV